jgi:hypothetical protein
MAPSERFAVEPPLVRPGQPLSPGMPETQGKSEAWFLDCRVPQKHFGFRDFKAICNTTGGPINVFSCELDKRK